jgi:hypothetical protein
MVKPQSGTGIAAKVQVGCRCDRHDRLLCLIA